MHTIKKTISMLNKLRKSLFFYLHRILEEITSNLRIFFKYGSFDMFKMIFIETITACNRRCSYCPNSKFDRGLIENTKKMEPGLFYKIIDELSRLRWSGYIEPHSYGEPLLDNRLLSFVSYIKNKLPSSTIQLFTNGDFLTVDLYKELIKTGVRQFYITQHLPELSGNVKKVLDYRKEYGDGKVLLLCFRRDKLNNRGGSVEVEGAVAIKKCKWPLHSIGVDYAGNVLFCCNDYFSTVKLGNINSERLIDIWNKPYYKKLRKEVKKGIFELEICKKCKYQL
jgi:radical SAM protein with 4Fe4S-binding SPASM domain